MYKSIDKSSQYALFLHLLEFWPKKNPKPEFTPTNMMLLIIFHLP